MPDRERLGPACSGPGCEVVAGTNDIIEMPCPLCTLDRPDGNDPVQSLRYRVPEFLRKQDLKNPDHHVF